MTHARVIGRLIAGTIIASVSTINHAVADSTSPRVVPHHKAAPAAAMKAQTKAAPAASAQVLQRPKRAAPGELHQILQRTPRKPSPLGLSSNAAPVKIECCTTWNSSEGTTGCASFEGNTCPDYAPFEAY